MNKTNKVLFPAGHFYSPVVDVEEIKQRENEIWKLKIPSVLSGIELNVPNQLQLIKEFSKYYHDIPFQENESEEFRYYYNNSFFSYFLLD